jgi:HAD superfamily hydrolase (TIGR01509 family)
MIKAIIFDCFGVLISDALEGIVAELRESQPETVEQIVATISAASKGLITRQESSDTVASLLGISTDEYKDRIKNGEVKNRQLLEYIAGLRLHYKTALLSNVSKHGLEVRFSPEELSACFDTVVASGDIGYAKPEPQAYEITADRLGVRLDECVMIDDREDYCRGATGVGMQSVQYESFDRLRRVLKEDFSISIELAS